MLKAEMVEVLGRIAAAIDFSYSLIHLQAYLLAKDP